MGGQSAKPTRYSSLWTETWSSGIWTNRNPLRSGPTTHNEAKYYGPRNDCFWDGLNIEISQRLTCVRRPGQSVYNSRTFAAVDAFYEFRLFNTNTETIKVMADTATALYDGTGPATQNLVWTKSAGASQTFMQYVANILYFGNGVDQKKWIQNPVSWTANTKYLPDGFQTFVIDPNGNIEQLIQCIIPVTNIQVSSDVLTVVFDRPVVNYLSVGLNINFQNLVNATFLNNYNPNNQLITISNVSGSTIQAPLNANNYGPAADTGQCYVVEGGTPYSGNTQPTWNTTVGGTTTDNVALWVNRGPTIENIGIVGPTQQSLGVKVNTNTNAWADTTYYSILNSIIDTNGNLQQTTTSGLSGYYGSGGNPAWATVLGGTTADGTVVWTLTELAANLVWAANTNYSDGALVVATPTNGVPSVFQLQSFAASQISGNVSAYLWPVSHTTSVGTFSKTYPLSIGSAVASATGNSFLFNPPANPDQNPVQWATLNSSGTITGYTTPFPSYGANYNMVLLGNLIIPEAGNYTFTITHKDGMIWGMGGGASVVSGPSNDPFHNTQTAVSGYPVFGGTNQSQLFTDNFVVSFPAGGTYPIEIDYDFWYHSGQTLTMTVNGINPVPGTISTTRKSGPTTPTWQPFSTAYAPGYSLTTESNGQLVWANIGPVTDFAWATKTNYLTNSSAGIVDANGYLEVPFESGITSTLAPTFTKTLNGITADNPNLIWVNKGKASVIPAGNLSTSAGGWNYAIALVNTLTDTVSNAGPVTASTGSFVGASGVTLTGGLPTTIDPQVDYVAIFRTKDGGGMYYLIPSTYNQNTVYTLPLSQYLASGYVDTTPDASLETLVSPALSLENSPPPAGIINFAYHLGRLFGSVGNVVYWSSGPDAPVGNGNEGWSPSNEFTYPSLVKRLVPTSIGLLVFTVSDVYLIAGKAEANDPLFTVPYVAGLGLLSYNALDTNGTLIYLFTADKQFVELNPHNGVTQLGNMIGDRLEKLNPANVYVAWHVSGSTDQAIYVSDGSTGWWRLMTTPAPETGETWSPFATIQGGCKAVQSIETTPGNKTLLLGPSGSGPVLQRDYSVSTDNGITYPAYGVLGNIVLAHPGQIAELVFITTDALAIGSHPVISVLLDEVSGTFEQMPSFVADPTQLTASSTLYGDRFYFSQTQQPALCRHLQVRFDWPSEAYTNELLSLTIFGGFAAELS